MSRTAYVLTHIGRDEVDRDQLGSVITGLPASTDIYYVPETGMHVAEYDQDRMDLPPGYLDGIYAGILDDRDLGYLADDDSARVVSRYDTVRVGGSDRAACVPETLRSLREARDRLGLDTDIALDPDLLYPRPPQI